MHLCEFYSQYWEQTFVNALQAEAYANVTTVAGSVKSTTSKKGHGIPICGKGKNPAHTHMHECENAGRDRWGSLNTDAAQTDIVPIDTKRTSVVQIDTARIGVVQIDAARIGELMEGKEMEGKRIDMLIYNALY
jgi:hypothetical protein